MSACSAASLPCSMRSANSSGSPAPHTVRRGAPTTSSWWPDLLPTRLGAGGKVAVATAAPTTLPPRTGERRYDRHQLQPAAAGHRGAQRNPGTDRGPAGGDPPTGPGSESGGAGPQLPAS